MDKLRQIRVGIVRFNGSLVIQTAVKFPPSPTVAEIQSYTKHLGILNAISEEKFIHVIEWGIGDVTEQSSNVNL
jgi:hypothetical protein